MSDPTARDHILDAAERLFAARGFPRTTIKQIGHEAGVNSALMYYYFGDKERLYREVLHRLVGSLIQGAGRGLDAGGSPERRLRAFLQAQAETLAANPRFARLLVRELADSDAAYAVEQIQLLAGSIFRRLCDLIREGQTSGAFRQDLDPRFAAISTLAQVAYFFMARPAVRILLGFGAEGPPATVVRAFSRHAADYALAALAPQGARRPARPRARSAR
jgi:AcrR family transcriptional regulator